MYAKFMGAVCALDPKVKKKITQVSGPSPIY